MKHHESARDMVLCALPDCTYCASRSYVAIDVSFEKIEKRLQLMERADGLRLPFVAATKENAKEYWIFRLPS